MRDPNADVRVSAAVAFLPLLGVLLLVAALRSPAHLTGDEGPILAATHRLLHGQYAVTGVMDATKFLWHGPGLPTLLAPLVALGVPVSGLRLLSPLLMFLAAVLFYRLLRLRLSRRASLIGAYALGLYAPGYYVIGTVDKDPLALVLTIITLDGTARYLKQGRRRHAVLAGLSFAWLAMTRLEYGWVIALGLLAGGVWWLTGRLGRGSPQTSQSARRWLLVCAVAMAGCLPWLVYTNAITGHFFYWGNSGGLSLYWMSSPSPTQLGQWHAPHTVLSDPALAAYRPFFHYLATLHPVQRDLELQHVAVAQALGHPAKYALNLLANLGRMFIGLPFSFTLPLVLVIGMAIINGGILTGLAGALARLIRRRASLPRESIPFLVFGIVAFVVHLLPTAEPRMLLPIVPVAIWVIGQAFTDRRSIRGNGAGSADAAALSLAAPWAELVR